MTSMEVNWFYFFIKSKLADKADGHRVFSRGGVAKLLTKSMAARTKSMLHVPAVATVVPR